MTKQVSDEGGGCEDRQSNAPLSPHRQGNIAWDGGGLVAGQGGNAVLVRWELALSHTKEG